MIRFFIVILVSLYVSIAKADWKEIYDDLVGTSNEGSTFVYLTGELSDPDRPLIYTLDTDSRKTFRSCTPQWREDDKYYASPYRIICTSSTKEKTRVIYSHGNITDRKLRSDLFKSYLDYYSDNKKISKYIRSKDGEYSISESEFFSCASGCSRHVPKVLFPPLE